MIVISESLNFKILGGNMPPDLFKRVASDANRAN